MSDRNGTVSPKAPGTKVSDPVPTGPIDVPTAVPEVPPAAGSDEAAGPHATAPVSVRPSVRGPRRGPLTRMGPWAPVAGAGLGVVLGAVVAVLLAGTADGFRDWLALVFVVVGLGMLGASGTLLADEVQIMRRGGRLLSGVTPARLLLVVTAFVLFLAAYVAR